MIRLALSGLMAGVLLATPSSTATGDRSTGSTADRAQGRQVFTLISTDKSRKDGLVAATGPVHAQGVDVAVSGLTDRFTFPDGSITIRHKVTPGSGRDSYDPVTCMFTFSEKGTWKVVKGTGAYAHAKGKGTHRVLGEGFGCGVEKPPKLFTFKVRLTGDLRY